MFLEFTYDIEKDIENWIKATKAKNNPNPTRMHLQYMSEMGEEFTEPKIRTFIREHKDEWTDIPNKLTDIKVQWAHIEAEYFERAKAIFQQSLSPEEIKVFLTTDNRATYNLQKQYFFLSIHTKSPMLTIMHELFHFFTWQVFHDEVESGRIGKACYNDIKESLTVLLNTEFSDLLEGAEDKGYPQHKELREMIKEKWLETKDIVRVFESAKALCK